MNDVGQSRSQRSSSERSNGTACSEPCAMLSARDSGFSRTGLYMACGPPNSPTESGIRAVLGSRTARHCGSKPRAVRTEPRSGRPPAIAAEVSADLEAASDTPSQNARCADTVHPRVRSKLKHRVVRLPSLYRRRGAVHSPTQCSSRRTHATASDHPALPHEGTVERCRHGAEDEANDNPGP
jgi:hypothetical protein